MIVTCPSCDAKYRVNAEALEARGGRAKCASCAHVWTVEEDALPLVETVDAPKPDSEPVAQAEPEPAPAPSLREKPHAAIRAREDARRRKARLATEGLGWAGVAACLMLTLGAAFIFRVDVVEIWPRSAGAYAAVGLDINPTGLEVRGLEASISEEEGTPVLIVEGEVQNVTGRSRESVSLLAQVLDDTGQVLAEWSLFLESPSLEPGTGERFRTSFPAPPEAGSRVEIVLAPQNS